MSLPKLSSSALIVSVLLIAAPTWAALSPEEKCLITKQKIAALHHKCLSDAAAKAIKKGTAEDVTKCDEKFADKWQKAADKAAKKGASCFDAPAAEETVQARVAAEEDAVAAILTGCPGLPKYGACWIRANASSRIPPAVEESCADACTRVGLSYSTLTDTAISGASRPLDVCVDLASELTTFGSFDVSVGSFGEDSGCSTLGCHVLGGSGIAIRLCTGGAATAGAKDPAAARICACE